MAQALNTYGLDSGRLSFGSLVQKPFSMISSITERIKARIDELSVSSFSILLLRTYIRKLIAKVCIPRNTGHLAKGGAILKVENNPCLDFFKVSL